MYELAKIYNTNFLGTLEIFINLRKLILKNNF